MQKQAYIIRFIHFLVSLYFSICIAYLYYSIFINQAGKILYIAIISILIEGLVIFLNNSNCPLGILHTKYGDNKTFFQLFLPKSIAEKIIPIVAIISITGLVLFFTQRILN
jgi:hypothetical protein